MHLANTDFELLENFFTADQSAFYLARLTETIPWKQKTIRLFGKDVLEPRLSSWHGNPEAEYTYSGISMAPRPWTPELLAVKAAIEPACGTQFNSVLLNFYRNERDSMGLHSDDEKELGPAPIIASVSFGTARRFVLKPRSGPEKSRTISLASGTLLIMRGRSQALWKHGVPKETKPCGPRLNLTFRTIVKIP